MLESKKMLRSSIVAFIFALVTLAALVGFDSAEAVAGLSPGITSIIASSLIFIMALAAGGALYAVTELIAHRRAASRAGADRKDES